MPIICFQFRPMNVSKPMQKSSFLDFLALRSLYRSISTSQVLLFNEKVGALFCGFRFIIYKYMPTWTSSLAFMLFNDLVIDETHSWYNSRILLLLAEVNPYIFHILSPDYWADLFIGLMAEGGKFSTGSCLLGWAPEHTLFACSIISLLSSTLYFVRSRKLSLFCWASALDSAISMVIIFICWSTSFIFWRSLVAKLRSSLTWLWISWFRVCISSRWYRLSILRV